MAAPIVLAVSAFPVIAQQVVVCILTLLRKKRRLRRKRLSILQELFESSKRRQIPLWRVWKFERSKTFYEVDVQRMNESAFRGQFRMPRALFAALVESIAGLIRKEVTPVDNTIDVNKRVAVTIYCLASGCSYRVVANQFGIGISTVCGIIEDVIMAIIEVHGDLVHFPSSEVERIAVSNGFLQRHRFPFTLGALDGSHIPIVPPHVNPADYFCYKHFHSVILLAAVDYKCRFTYINVGSPGRMNDAGVFQTCGLQQMVAGPNSFPNKYHIIADSAFPLMPTMMKRYPEGNLSQSQFHFNKRLSSARMVVECAFGHLKNKWRILLHCCEWRNLQKICCMIRACVILHNMIINDNSMPEVEVRSEDDDCDSDDGQDVFDERRNVFRRAGNIKRDTLCIALETQFPV